MKTKAGKIVKLAALAILAAAAVCGIGVYRYVSNVPELTANNWLQDVVADNTLSWNNLYNIKCSGDYSVELRILDTNIPDAKISEDKAEVYVGSRLLRAQCCFLYFVQLCKIGINVCADDGISASAGEYGVRRLAGTMLKELLTGSPVYRYIYIERLAAYYCKLLAVFRVLYFALF